MKRSRSHPERPASAGDALREREESFRLLFASNPLPMWVYDLETLRFLEVNDAAVAHYGYTREEFLQMRLTDIRPPEDVERLLENVHRERPVFQHSGEWRHRLKDGRLIDVEITSHTLEFAGRKAALVAARDITERKETEKKIQRLNRVYSVLSGINEAIVRIGDRQELFNEACRIAVERGFFRMAWVGLVDAESGVVKPVACVGVEPSCLARIRVRADESPEGQGPTGTAIREGRSVVYNDIEHDARMEPWRKEVRHNGYRSSAAFPLRLGEKVVGALALYSPEPFFFDEDEVKLFEELAADISFALQAMEHEEHRAMAEGALAHSEEKYRTLVEQVPAITYTTSLEEGAGTLYINPRARAILGYTQAEWLADPTLWSKRLHPDDRAGVLAEFDHTRATGEPLLCEYRIIGRDGQVRWLHDEATVVRDAGGKPLFLHGIAVDITERKRVEEALQKSEAQFRSVWENATDGMRLTDGEGMVVAVNESFCRIVGKPRAEIEGQLMSGVYAREDRDRILRKHCERFASCQVPPHLERYVTLWDGRKVWLEVSNCFLETSSSRPLLLGVFRDATPRRQVEEALHESEERFRSLVENAAVGIYRTTPDGRVLMANQTLVRMLGYNSFEELAARDLEAEGFEPTYPRSAFRERLEAEGTVTGFEAAWKRRDRSVIFVRESARAIRGDNGKTHYYDGIVEDVTERKRAEDALRESEAKFRSLADTASSAIFIFRGKHFVYVNRTAAVLTGYTQAELLAKGIGDLIHPDFRDLVLGRALARQSGEKVPSRYDFKIITKGGEERWCDFSAGMITFEGQPAGLGTAFDITDRKRAEEELRASEARYRELVENAVYGIHRTTIEGRFLHVNPALVRMLGYDSKEELMALNVIDLYCYPDDRRRLIEQHRHGELIEGTEIEWKRRDGKPILLRFSGRAACDARGEIAYFEMVVEDVTQRRALEKQVAALQKFDAIGRLAGGIAHDFNNVIGAIMGWAELSLDEVPPEGRLRSHLQKIRTQAERAAGLTRQLLAFARRQLLEPKNINLNEIITETLGLLEKVIGKDIEIRTALLPDLRTARADRSQLEQVLMNLCLNARDAMPTGGTLAIETHNAQVDDEYCRLHPYAKPGDYVTLVISDTGAGMDAATIEHIFEPFFSTKETGKGTGLGLATVYGIVKQHGGFVNVYSELGYGSTFRVYLPAVAAAATREDRAATETVRGGTETILVAEDHEGIFEMVRETLGKSGYRTLLARDGEQAVELFREHQQEIALALLDVVMPKLSGPEAFVQISAMRPEVPVIFTTGYTSEVAQLSMLSGKGAVILQKPYSPNALLRKVREVLDAPRQIPDQKS